MKSSKKIGSIQFKFLSPKMIRKMAASEVITSEIYDPDGYPIEGGLMDSRLGVIDPGLRCKTCAGKIGECPGHFGFLTLARPIIHIKFVKLVHKLLNSTCEACGRLLLNDAAIEKFAVQMEHVRERESELASWSLTKDAYKAAAGIKQCPHCDAKVTPIKYEKPHSYFQEKQPLTPTDIRDRLERIPDEDLEILGMNPQAARPEWVVFTVLPVPPVTVRPSITLETGERAEDDLTHKLVDIVRINQRLKQTIDAGAPGVIIEDLWELLQYHVTTFIDNDIPTLPPARHRAGRPLKGITQRIKSKEGRFRHNLAGKRVNFSARTVISPDPRLSICEVGVPERIAMELTYPEIVSERNIDYLRHLVMDGSKELEGANYVIRPDGRRKRITDDVKEQLAEELEMGYIVERHLRNGDIVLFNRQPSLHRQSIMCHRVRILPYNTFRVNPAACPPYNADFDGDEMNLHVPQNPEGRAEAEMLMSIRTQLISPRFGGPVIGGHQDHLSGLYYLTHKNTYLTRNEAHQMLFNIGINDLKFAEKPAKVEDGVEYYSGKQVFSALIPKGINLSYKSKVSSYFPHDTVEDCKKYDTYVDIKDGELVCGVIDEASVGAFSGKLLLKVIKTGAGVDFIDHLTKLSLEMLKKRGMSIGLSDIQIPAEATEKIEGILDDAEANSHKLIEDFRANKLEAWPGMTIEETFETELLNRLNKARDRCVEVVGEYTNESNPAITMAITGARGKLLNLAQMAACLGQQAIGGKRVSRGYRNRSLPHFTVGDIGPKAKGFVRRSYGSGLDPFEFFYVCMSGREGLTDTSMRTPKSGYMYRRLANALQDLTMHYDGTVRDNRDTIIQFKYGEDGINPAQSEWGTINLMDIIENVRGGV